MVGQVLDIEHTLDPDNLAVEISNMYNEWNNYRRPKLEEWKELRNYLFATDTRTTANALLPWSNTTTTPKLTQIRDNLHANYFANLFPSQDWMRWEGDTEDDATRLKATVIQSYLTHKMRKTGFEDTVSDLLCDYIDYGNCFAKVEYDVEAFTDSKKEYIVRYQGPRLVRISPFDIVFNPTAVSFEKSPKIVRAIVTLGEIKKLTENNPAKEFMEGVFSKMVDNRATVLSANDTDKGEGYTADGFSDIKSYYGSDYVEVLTFYGDIYDREAKEYLGNREITIVDRAYVLDNKLTESWFGKPAIFHAGWRKRPDNLYAMGPLDNLVGLQYRIDHLENLKADVFDQIAYPVKVIRGDVEEFTWEPGVEIYVGEEGDVSYLAPDGTALQADFQIETLMNRMEEMAGAPKQAMGIRTPGEKTAFEVQQLQNSASRIFEHKTAHFERTFLEPILNAMLEIGRRHMDRYETVSGVNQDTGSQFFIEVQKDDITAEGKLVPIGARHFAERAKRLQNLAQLMQIKTSDPTVQPHISGKLLAKILAEELGEDNLYGENIALTEQRETQSAQMDEAVNLEEDQMSKVERGL